MRNITIHRCGYGPIQLRDSFPAIGCGHAHYPNFDGTRDVAAAAIYAQSPARTWLPNNEPLDGVAMG